MSIPQTVFETCAPRPDIAAGTTKDAQFAADARRDVGGVGVVRMDRQRKPELRRQPRGDLEPGTAELADAALARPVAQPERRLRIDRRRDVAEEQEVGSRNRHRAVLSVVSARQGKG